MAHEQYTYRHFDPFLRLYYFVYCTTRDRKFPLSIVPEMRGAVAQYAPFILTARWLDWLCYSVISFSYCQRKCK